MGVDPTGVLVYGIKEDIENQLPEPVWKILKHGHDGDHTLKAISGFSALQDIEDDLFGLTGKLFSDFQGLQLVTDPYQGSVRSFGHVIDKAYWGGNIINLEEHADMMEKVDKVFDEYDIDGPHLILDGYNS